MANLNDCLLVAYEFPPEGGVKVHRAAKFARYLPDFGFRPIVLTTRKAQLQQPDPSLEAELPDSIRIVRTPPCSPSAPYRALRELWDDLKSSRPHTKTATAPPGRHRSPALGLAQHLAYPDLMAGWAAVARMYLPDIAAAGAPRVVWATAPPFSALLVGRRYAHALGVPWIADIRDMFCDNPHNPPAPHFAGRARVLEREVLGDAAIVVTVTEGIAATLDGHYGIGGKTSVIYNGFDFDPKPTPLPPYPPLHIGHLGSVVRSSGRNFDSLFEAWRILRDREPEVAQQIHFTQVGLMDRGNRRAWDHFVAELGVEAQVEQIGPLPQRDAIAMLSRFNLLLLHNSGALITGGFDSTALSTKVFEYLATNRKIFALGGEGEAARLIRAHDAGWVAPYDQPEQIAAMLIEIAAAARRGQLERGIDSSVMRFHRRNATAELAGLFMTLITPQ